MKNREIVNRLRAEAKEHTPDVRVDLSEVRPAPLDGGAVAVPAKRRTHSAVLIAAVALILVLAALLPFFLRGGGGPTTLVISINPSAELTLEEGRVMRTRPLNKDAAVLLAGCDLLGMTAEEACLTFAELAGARNLIGTDGVRIRVSGKDGGRLLREIHGALDALFEVKDLDDESFQSLMGGYDEDAMERFEDYVLREYGEKQQQYLARAQVLLETYRADLEAVDLRDRAAMQAFNEKYLLLGEDLLFELDEDDDEDDDIREELLEEYDELMRLLERDEKKAFEELFKGFMELLEEEYEDDD